MVCNGKKNRKHLFTQINFKNINIVAVKTEMQKLCAYAQLGFMNIKKTVNYPVRFI